MPAPLCEHLHRCPSRWRNRPDLRLPQRRHPAVHQQRGDQRSLGDRPIGQWPRTRHPLQPPDAAGAGRPDPATGHDGGAADVRERVDREQRPHPGGLRERHTADHRHHGVQDAIPSGAGLDPGARRQGPADRSGHWDVARHDPAVLVPGLDLLRSLRKRGVRARTLHRPGELRPSARRLRVRAFPVRAWSDRHCEDGHCDDAGLHRAPDHSASVRRQICPHRDGVRRIHPERGHGPRLGICELERDLRFAAHGGTRRLPDRTVSEHQRRVQWVAIRPGVLVRRLPPEHRLASVDRQEDRAGDQRILSVGDPGHYARSRAGSVSPPRP